MPTWLVIETTAIIHTVVAAMTTIVPAVPASFVIIIVVSLTRYILHSQDSLIQFTSIGCLFRLGRLFDRFELHKGVVALHIDTKKLTKRLKQELQIFLTRRFFVEIDDKQSVRRLNVPATLIFLALDAAISSSEFDAKSFGYVGDIPDVVVSRNKQRKKKSQCTEERRKADDEGRRMAKAQSDRRYALN
jgi:hypothetical protein